MKDLSIDACLCCQGPCRHVFLALSVLARNPGVSPGARDSCPWACCIHEAHIPPVSECCPGWRTLHHTQGAGTAQACHSINGLSTPHPDIGSHMQKSDSCKSCGARQQMQAGAAAGSGEQGQTEPPGWGASRPPSGVLVLHVSVTYIKYHVSSHRPKTCGIPPPWGTSKFNPVPCAP